MDGEEERPCDRAWGHPTVTLERRNKLAKESEEDQSVRKTKIQGKKKSPPPSPRSNMPHSQEMLGAGPWSSRSEGYG